MIEQARKLSGNMTSQGTTSQIDHWIDVAVPRSQARIRLLCFPFAGAGTLAFRTWPYNLPDFIEVCAVQLPGREKRLDDKPYIDVATLVKDLAAVLPPLLERPYALFGHSMGALIAFELARELARRGEPEPRHFFVSGRRAPHIPDTSLLHPLDDEAFRVGLKRFKGMSEKLFSNDKLMSFFLPTLRADFTLFETHRLEPGEPLSCPMSIFGGREDVEATPELLAGWQEHTTGGSSLRLFPGDHFFLRSSQDELLAAIAEKLAGS